ncbi:hypothetical protein GCK72_020623 [Caenorhabditis remanei]|uniref:Uncharacterized protein n=1 Tax=Caenorhabditis remanei TaxID=31234 RepID=A0A6A5GHN1_CAERE|nr:hypothetical protein GCK72_020623 [Caenorhabditis remanei]KAF1754065.1 hypothetical protein GCK72_020623 [Caenorhabditis remanei]
MKLEQYNKNLNSTIHYDYTRRPSWWSSHRNSIPKIVISPGFTTPEFENLERGSPIGHVIQCNLQSSRLNKSQSNLHLALPQRR